MTFEVNGKQYVAIGHRGRVAPRSSSPTLRRCAISATRWCSTFFGLLADQKTRGGNVMRSRCFTASRSCLSQHRTDDTACAGRRRHARTAAPMRQGAAELLMNHRTTMASGFSPAGAHQQVKRQRIEARLTRAARGGAATSGTRRPPSPRTASSTSRIRGACCTRSTRARATWPHRLAHGPQAGKRQVNNRGAPSGQSVITPAERAGADHRRPTRTAARSIGKRMWAYGAAALQITAPFSRSRTRSSSAPPAATAAYATGRRA